MDLIVWFMTIINSILERLAIYWKGSLLHTCMRHYAPETKQLLVDEEDFSWDYTYGSLEGSATISKPSLQIKDTLLDALHLDLGDMSFLEDEEWAVYSGNDVEIMVEE